MKKGLIIYSGTYGSTEQYAQWISEETKLPVFAIEKIPLEALEHYQTLILGSAVVMGRLKISDWLKDSWEKIKSKELMMFTVSATDPKNKKAIGEILDASMDKEMRAKIKIWSLPGRLVMKMLPLPVRGIVSVMRAVEYDPEKRKILEDADHLHRENVFPMTNEIVKRLTLKADSKNG